MPICLKAADNEIGHLILSGYWPKSQSDPVGIGTKIPEPGLVWKWPKLPEYGRVVTASDESCRKGNSDFVGKVTGMSGIFGERTTLSWVWYCRDRFQNIIRTGINFIETDLVGIRKNPLGLILKCHEPH
jgi:hypothetical protein